VRLPWRRDRIRRCVRCDEQWRVPYELARRYRPSKWRVGVSPADHRGSLGGASVDYMLDNVRARSADAYRQMAVTDSLRTCRRCGSGAWSERKATRDDAPDVER
jgi:hypothetical protein